MPTNRRRDTTILMGGGGATQLDSGTTEYGCLIGVDHSLNATETAHGVCIGFDGKLKNLKVALSGAPGAGKNYVFMIRKGGASTTLTCSIADTDTEGEDVTHEVSISAKDLVCIMIVPSGTPAVVYGYWSAEFVRDE